MKSLIVRLSVVTLAVAGFAASTVVSQAAPQKHKVSSVVVGQSPTPCCLPWRDTRPCTDGM